MPAPLQEAACSLSSQHLHMQPHPAAGAHPTDVRMTTRFKQDDLTEGITGEYALPRATAFLGLRGCTCSHALQTGCAHEAGPAQCCSELAEQPATVVHAAGAIHETGHALYEQGRNLEYDGLPVNQVGLSGASLNTALLALRSSRA